MVDMAFPCTIVYHVDLTLLTGTTMITPEVTTIPVSNVKAVDF